MKDPERYLHERQVRVRCVVRPERSAKLDATLRTVIGHDIFYFSSRAARKRFLDSPLSFCKWFTDPVTLARFAARRGSPRLDYHGRPYYFGNDSTFTAFKATPDSFAVRRGM